MRSGFVLFLAKEIAGDSYQLMIVDNNCVMVQLGTVTDWTVSFIHSPVSTDTPSTVIGDCVSLIIMDRVRETDGNGQQHCHCVLY